MDLNEYSQRVLGEGTKIDLSAHTQEADAEALLLVLNDYPFKKTLARIKNELDYGEDCQGVPLYIQMGSGEVHATGNGKLTLDAKKFQVLTQLLEAYDPKFYSVKFGVMGRQIKITDLLHTLKIGEGLSIHEFI